MKKFIPLLMFVILLGGCHQHTEPCDDHDHVKLYLQAYNEHLELFVETDPFAIGHASLIGVHITRLSDFKPAGNLHVTMNLITGSRGVRQRIEQAEQPGIYMFVLSPEAEGPTRVIFDVESEEGNWQFDAGMVHVHADYHDALHQAEHLQPDLPGGVAFTKQQSWIIDFETREVAFERLGTTIKTVGEVLPGRTDARIITAQTQGIVHFIDRPLYEGEMVRSGQSLIMIMADALADNNIMVRITEAQSRYTLAKQTYERTALLAADKIVSERDYQQAKAEYESASAAYHSLSRHFSAQGQSVKSPADGIISQVFVENGQFVEAGQPIMVVSRNKDMVVRALVQQRFASLLPHINTANLRDLNGNMHTLESLEGNVLSYARSVDPRSHLLAVHLQLGGNQPFVPGSMTDVYLKTMGTEPVLVIPAGALIEEQGNYFVFVQHHPEYFEKRQVHTGIFDGIQVEITRGLEAGERIVSKGAIMIKLAANSGELDPHAGHVH